VSRVGVLIIHERDEDVEKALSQFIRRLGFELLLITELFWKMMASGATEIPVNEKFTVGMAPTSMGAVTTGTVGVTEAQLKFVVTISSGA